MGRVCVVMLATMLSACEAADQSGQGVAAAFVGPSATTSLLQATINQPTFTSFPCSPAGQFFVRFVLTMTASSAIDLDQVTIHMVDGTNLGSPIVTIPQASLLSQFGTVHVAPGATATFPLQSQFPCQSLLPAGVSAEIVFLDAHHVSHAITVVTILPK